MHVCRLMTSDFMHGTGRFNPDMGSEAMYDRRDLENGLMYAEDYLGIGVKKCPSEHFNLKRFAAWARKQLCALEPQSVSHK